LRDQNKTTKQQNNKTTKPKTKTFLLKVSRVERERVSFFFRSMFLFLHVYKRFIFTEIKSESDVDRFGLILQDESKTLERRKTKDERREGSFCFFFRVLR